MRVHGQPETWDSRIELEEQRMANRRQFIQGAAALIGTAAASPRLTAFAQDATPSASPAAATPVVPVADVNTLPTLKKGQLTIHADQPLYTPWYEDNDPTNGKGFEGSLAYAIAERMGFTKDQVKWGYTSFNGSFAPGPKDFDFYMTEVSITDARKEAVDFSDPYYKSPLTVVAKKGSKVLEAKTLDDLKKFKFATQVGTTFYTYITEKIKPTTEPLVLDQNSDTLQTLENDQVDCVIEDRETAIYVTTQQYQDLAIAGILPGEIGNGMGAVFEKGSKLVPYFNSALASLIADGTRDKLADQWLPKVEGVPTYS
jgi:polar amino acid transport system substrate-binding protein